MGKNYVNNQDLIDFDTWKEGQTLEARGDLFAEDFVDEDDNRVRTIRYTSRDTDTFAQSWNWVLVFKCSYGRTTWYCVDLHGGENNRQTHNLLKAYFQSLPAPSAKMGRKVSK